MVMYPWKQQRLNDGYYDRNSSHPYESEDRHMSKSHSGYSSRDRYDRHRNSPKYRQRDESPARPSPRYSNKSSYTDRTRERERGTKSSPGDYRSGASENSSRNGSDRHIKNSNDNKAKEIESKDLQKTALRQCGDWAEYTSSSGKRYYYNTKTEVSQWEKPTDWTLDTPKSKKEYSREKDKHSYHSTSGENKYKQSSTNRYDDRNHKDTRTRDSSPSSRKDYDKYNERQNYYSDKDRYKSSSRYDSPRTNENSQRSNQSYHGTSSWSTINHDKGSDRRNYNDKENNSNDSYRNATSNYNRIGGSNETREDSSRSNQNEDIRQSVDMDISPGSTPTSSQANSRPESRAEVPATSSIPGGSTATPSATSISSLPGSGAGVTLKNLSSVLIQLGDKNIDSKKFTEQAIQTLQKLQEAISSRQVSIQNAGSSQSPRTTTAPSPYQQKSPTDSQKGNTTPLTSEKPYVANQPVTTAHTYRSQVPQGDEGVESPQSEHSCKSSKHDRVSPTPSQTSSQGAPVGASSLAAVAQKQSSVQLPSSLSNYYRDDLTQHVSGWQMNLAEKQANRLREEAHNIGSQLCTKISVNLKRARSEVRAGEINTTLQEQRILFIRQQILDLERSSKN